MTRPGCDPTGPYPDAVTSGWDSQQPDGFSRPQGWSPLPEGDDPAPDYGATPPPGSLGGSPSPVGFPPAPTAYPPAFPSPPAQPSWQQAPGWYTTPTLEPPPRPSRVSPALVILLVCVGLVMAIGVSGALIGLGPRPAPTPRPPVTPSVPWPTSSWSSSSPDYPSDTLRATWSLQAPKLRTNLTNPKILAGIDGSFDGGRVIDAGGPLVVVTAAEDSEAKAAVQALDPGTGAPLWRRDLPAARCATTLLTDGLLCASQVDPGLVEGVATAWRLQVLNPRTGEEVRHVDITASLTVVGVRDDHVMVVERRMPSPHVVVTGYSADLAQTWQVDLSTLPGQEEMFSEDRIYDRPDNAPGPVWFDRPRLRAFSHGLTALWAGGRTAFFDLAAGTLVGMPHCSRVVDDGNRLWCNDPDNASAYGYDLQPLFKTDPGVRLAFSTLDPHDGNVSRPVFLDQDGKALNVDLTTGKTIGLLAATSTGSAFGMTTWPGVYSTGNYTILQADDQTFGVDMSTGSVLWTSSQMDLLDHAYQHGGKLILTGFKVSVVNPMTGERTGWYEQDVGWETIQVGDIFLGISSDEIGRVDIP